MEWIAVSTALAVSVILGICLRGRRGTGGSDSSWLSPVTQQHLHLFRGGRLSEAAVESAKTQLRQLLEHGQVEEAEAHLRPGLHFAVQVQALAEIGSPQAGTILQRQLARRLSADPLEQSWYWIDLAHGLRHLNLPESVPFLLRCPASQVDYPLGQFFAAETACCPGFLDQLKKPLSPLGQSAVRILHQTLGGLRRGVQPQVLAEARLGEAIARLWKHRPARVDPMIVRVFLEALRQLQRSDHLIPLFAEQPYLDESIRRQLAELLTLEDALGDYLAESRAILVAQLDHIPEAQRLETLAAIEDLRADTGSVVLDRLENWTFTHRAAAVRTLAHCRHPRVATRLIDWTHAWIRPERRARKPRLHQAPAKSSAPDALPYREILGVMKHFPSVETEAFLLTAAHDFDPAFRAAALGSLGWWPAFQPRSVEAVLHRCYGDDNLEVRLAAAAALARLGHRAALQFFRQRLLGASEASLPETIRLLAEEGLTWLWPELEQLTDSDSDEISQNAREALEDLRESILGPPWPR